MLGFTSKLKWTSSEEKTEAGEPAKKHPIRILAVGGSGVGKSTIGNVILKNEFTGTFAAAQSVDSVTQKPQEEKHGRFVYVDVPGIPDSKEERTKEFYNMIVKEAMKPVNVILFVFKYERIDQGKFRRCKLLFRELTRSNAKKILIINDMNARGLGDTLMSEEEWAKEAQIISDEISTITNIEFKYIFAVKGSNMKSKMQELRNMMEKYPPAKKNDHLRTYNGLIDFVQKMKSEDARQEDVIADAKREIEVLEEHLEWANAMVKFTADSSYVASYFSSTVASSIDDWVAHYKDMAETLQAEIKQAEATIADGNRVQEIAQKSLDQALKEFIELRAYFKKQEASTKKLRK